MVNLASLVVALEAQTTAFVDGMRKGEEAINHLAETVAEQVKAISERFLEFEAIKEAFNFTKEVAESVAHLSELSQALGISTENLTKLQYAAKLEGIDDVSMAIQHLARTAQEATDYNTKLVLAFNAVGVSVNDLKSLAPDQIFAKTADGIAKYSDGIQKTALVQDIFGRSSAGFIAVLNRGSEGLKEAGNEAAIFGQVLDKQGAEAVKEFNDNLIRIGSVISGTFKQALVQASPGFTEITNNILNFVKTSGAIPDTLQVIGAAAIHIGDVIGKVFQIVSNVGEALYNVFQALLPSLQQAAPVMATLDDAIVDLSKTIADLINSTVRNAELFKPALESIGIVLQGLAISALTVVDTLQVVIRYIQGAVEVADLLQRIPTRADFLLHPIESTQKFIDINKQAQAIAKETFDDIGAIADKGDVYLDKILHGSGDALQKYSQQSVKAVNEAADAMAKSAATALGDEGSKPNAPTIDSAKTDAAVSAIRSVVAEVDKANQALASFGLQGGAAAAVYNANFGELSKTLDKITSQSVAAQRTFLELARGKGEISNADFTKLLDGLNKGVSISQQLKQSYIDVNVAKEQLANIDSIEKLDEAVLRLTGHQKEAALAAAAIGNRQLDTSLQTQQANAYLAQFTGAEKIAQAQEKINDLAATAAPLFDTLKSSVVGANTSDAKTQDEAIAKRAVAIAQFEQLYAKVQAFANASGNKELVDQAEKLRQSFAATANSFGEQDIQRQQKVNEQLAEYNELQQKAAEINSKLKVGLDAIADAQAHSEPDIQAMQEQDDLRNKAITELQAINDQMGKLASEANNPAITEGFQKMTASVHQLHAQTDQLAKTINEDFVNDSSNAFSEFVTGAKSAKDAAKEFVTSFENDLVRLASKQLMQQIFGGTGSTGGVGGFFAGSGGSGGGGGGSAGGLINLIGSFFGGGGATGASAAASAGFSSYAGESGDILEGITAMLATGGSVAADQRYTIGEQGRELFVPDDGGPAQIVGAHGQQNVQAHVAGTIIPNSKLSDLLTAPALNGVSATVNDASIAEATTKAPEITDPTAPYFSGDSKPEDGALIDSSEVARALPGVVDKTNQQLGATAKDNTVVAQEPSSVELAKNEPPSVQQTTSATNNSFTQVVQQSEITAAPFAQPSEPHVIEKSQPSAVVEQSEITAAPFAQPSEPHVIEKSQPSGTVERQAAPQVSTDQALPFSQIAQQSEITAIPAGPEVVEKAQPRPEVIQQHTPQDLSGLFAKSSETTTTAPPQVSSAELFAKPVQTNVGSVQESSAHDRLTLEQVGFFKSSAGTDDLHTAISLPDQPPIPQIAQTSSGSVPAYNVDAPQQTAVETLVPEKVLPSSIPESRLISGYPLGSEAAIFNSALLQPALFNAVLHRPYYDSPPVQTDVPLPSKPGEVDPYKPKLSQDGKELDVSRPSDPTGTPQQPNDVSHQSQDHTIATSQDSDITGLQQPQGFIGQPTEPLGLLQSNSIRKIENVLALPQTSDVIATPQQSKNSVNRPTEPAGVHTIQLQTKKDQISDVGVLPTSKVNSMFDHQLSDIAGISQSTVEPSGLANEPSSPSFVNLLDTTVPAKTKNEYGVIVAPNLQLPQGPSDATMAAFAKPDVATSAKLPNPANDVVVSYERRASGGNVNANQPYVVNEQGEELFIPATSGTIMSSNATNSAKRPINVTNNFHIEAPKGTVSRATQSQIAAQAARTMTAASNRNN